MICYACLSMDLTEVDNKIYCNSCGHIHNITIKLPTSKSVMNEDFYDYDYEVDNDMIEQLKVEYLFK